MRAVLLVSDAHFLVSLLRLYRFQVNLPAHLLESLVSVALLITHLVGVSLKQPIVSHITR